MASERIQRRIDRLLDQIEEAADGQDWPEVHRLARQVLGLDSDNVDAPSFLNVAEAELAGHRDSHQVEDLPVGSVTDDDSSGDQPTSFAGGRYVVKSFLGEGGKKRVYLAHDSVLDREVALAVIKTEGLDDTSRSRVTREAQAMARLGDHPNILPIHDLGEESGQPYMVLPYMPGGDVEMLIGGAPDHRLPLERSLEIAKEVCRGLEFAHFRGIVHRDLKPGNVWVTAEGTAKIGDFGLAMTMDRSRLTQEGMMVGTVSYMPPEQAMGSEVTPRADLYSLGAMLYEMVCGRPPFLGDDSVAIIGQHVNTPPVAPTWHNSACPRPLEALILRLLAKDPSERPESAGDVLTAIEGIDLATSAEERTEEEVRSLDSLAGGVFVGRQREMGQLKAALEEALGGKGRMVTLVGEAGIGKTRTAEELATYARLRGAQVLWGRCYEEQGMPPYWPWVQALRSYVRDQEPEKLRSELGSGAADIAEIVSELRERLPDIEPPPATENPEYARFRLFDAVTSFLKAAGQTQALVLMLDDLHWADRPSLLLLEFLTREISSSRVLLVGTYRDVELSRQHPLAQTLGGLTRERLFERVVLRGLTQADVGRFIEVTSGFAPPPGLLTAVHTQTEGNPLFVTEVVRLLVQEGDLTPERATERKSWSVRIPEGVREVIGRRLNALSERCNQTLTVASVIGREFTLEQLGPLIDEVSQDRLLDILEEALSARVIDELPTSVGRYHFTHVLIQETLVEELSLTRRVRLHATVAETLEALYGDQADSNATELAHHFAQAEAVLGSDKLVRYSLLAGERALAAYAHEEALDYFQRALDHDPVEDVRNRILRQRGKLRLGLFDGKGAVDDLEQLLADSIHRGDTAQELESLLGLGSAHYIISLDAPEALSKAREFYEQAYALARQLGDKAAMARSLIPTTHFATFWSDYRDQAFANIEEALALGRELGDDDLIIDSMKARLGFLEANEALDQGEDILKQLESRHDLLRLKEHYFSMMWWSYRSGRFERCIECCDAGIELAARLGAYPVQYPTIKALALLDLGRYGEAWEALQQEVSDEAHPFGRVHQQLGVGIYLAELMAFEQAVETLREVVVQAKALSRPWMCVWAQSILVTSLVRLLAHII